MDGFIEIFKKLIQKRKEAKALPGGGAAASSGAVTPNKGYGEELSDDEIREMGRSYIGPAPGRVSVLQQFLQKARKRK